MSIAQVRKKDISLSTNNHYVCIPAVRTPCGIDSIMPGPVLGHHGAGTHVATLVTSVE